MVTYNKRTVFDEDHYEILKDIIQNEKRVSRPKLYALHPEFKKYSEKAIANKIISIKNETKKLNAKTFQ